MVNNLVVNALNYGTPGHPVRVAVEGGEADVRVIVANSGHTIEPETLARIFEPLTRGPAQRQSKDSGLGLGLYIACEIAKAHGGKIEARSESMETVFTVHLPRRR